MSTDSLYIAHEKIYPREVKGKFQSLRNLAVVVLLGLYYVLPWLRWDGHQAVLFDLPARKFYIFYLTFWPQDFYYLTWLLVIAAMTLFLSTAVAGRLWCGYACPQTVWTEAFIWMERWTEGDRNAQIRLDHGPWNRNKLWRKSLKQLLWIGFSAWTGFTFVGYFTPVTVLWQHVLTLQLGSWELFWGVFYSLATYGNAGFLREQVCKYMCPYARFQSAMFDRDTLVISYNNKRGEPRGKRKKGANPLQDGLGDCVDCKQCVHVCPTGIDIRNGLQYECIACGACIDACNGVMSKMGYPKDLILYTSQNSMNRGKLRPIRPRTAVYAVIWFGLICAFLATLANRVPMDLDVLRDRNSLYQKISADAIDNVYTLKVMNKDNRGHRYRIAVTGIDGIGIVDSQVDIEVKSGEILNVPVRVRSPLASIQQANTEITFTLSAEASPQLTTTVITRFLAPTNRQSIYIRPRIHANEHEADALQDILVRSSSFADPVNTIRS